MEIFMKSFHALVCAATAAVVMVVSFVLVVVVMCLDLSYT